MNSRKYGRYFDAYEADPIYDLELVVIACLRQHIFEGALAEHPDPNAEMIAEAQARGNLPHDLSRGTILDP
jgi:hypothetical protein